VAQGLRRRGINVTTTNDAGLASSSDEAQLEYARQTNRVIVTHDDDLTRLHYQNIPHSGIAFARS